MTRTRTRTNSTKSILLDLSREEVDVRTCVGYLGRKQESSWHLVTTTRPMTTRSLSKIRSPPENAFTDTNKARCPHVTGLLSPQQLRPCPFTLNARLSQCTAATRALMVMIFTENIDNTTSNSWIPVVGIIHPTSRARAHRRARLRPLVRLTPRDTIPMATDTRTSARVQKSPRRTLGFRIAATANTLTTSRHRRFGTTAIPGM